MSRRARQRRQARREVRDLPASVPGTRTQPIATARPPAQRNTMRVAQALREAQEAIPHIVRNPRRPLAEAQMSQSAPSPVQGAAQRSPRREGRLDASPPPVQNRLERLQSCKPRPSGRRKSGGGTGRPFVPWCS